MATATRTSKPAKPTATAAPKAAPRKVVTTRQKSVAVAAKPKPAKSAVKKTAGEKTGIAKPVALARQLPVKSVGALPVPVKPKISAEQRRHYVEVAAYFIAERNGFSASSVLDHWVQAEAEIDRLLRQGKINL